MKTFVLFARPICVILLTSLLSAATVANEATIVRSTQSGSWSSPTTWDSGKAPQTGDSVVIGKDHHILYDVESNKVLRLVQIAGKLEFARDRNTLLEVGLITLTSSEIPTEEGFDCLELPTHIHPGQHQAELLIGTPDQPIPVEHHATIRLHYVEGMDKESCPALLNCGGRLEIHGEPMQRTWVKMHRGSEVGDTSVVVDESVADWREGDRIIVTSTERQRDRRGSRGGFLDNAQTEMRQIVRVGSKDFTGGYPIRFDKPLTFDHYAVGDFRAEVANLTRNVVIESAQPDGVRGHTMIHAHSSGSISYAEFRHLGKRDLLGRYSLHFHLCGDTMRGSSVIGASIWDSHNRFLTIHGTDAIVVRDCVGYKSIGHGFFLEDGTEVNNILDRNLAVTVGPGKPLPKQVIPFDPNRGAGFWFANCQNVFTRNVAAECAEYGYRFDCKEEDGYDPVRPIRQPNGEVVQQDTRVMPFIRFQDNEAHTMKFFCLNLRGVTRPEGGGLDIYNQNLTLAKEAAEAMPAGGVPFWIRDFRCWKANWAVHLGTTGVFVDGLDVFDSDVAIWRSIMDRSGYRRITTEKMRVNDIHNPLSMGMPEEDENESGSEGRRRFGGVSSFKDSMPPTTMITKAVREGNLVRIEGSVADTSDLKQVVVNGRLARSVRDSFVQWEIVLEAESAAPLQVIAAAEDVNGLTEVVPHEIYVGSGASSSGSSHQHVKTMPAHTHIHQ
ncbi:G8 domain-containing protein [Blastopirellula sp. J2-11]|uniref:G8 domain-containing protein n=1 Tax=Blastopirellula sp. J2-11 TaxID=2943192 RepID=UPI0021C5740E|nr:G8 domain-containing protein [Blastopirellula sp. J2-11]UUO06599.1 G8 domain-containing protein [Blastopirellula sp. J2-11]